MRNWEGFWRNTTLRKNEGSPRFRPAGIVVSVSVSKKLLFSGGGLVIPPENQSVRVSGTFGNTGKSGEGVTPECQTKKTAVSGLKT